MKLSKIFLLLFVSFSAAGALYPSADALTSAEDYYRAGQALYARGDYIGANAAFKRAETAVDAADAGITLPVVTVKDSPSKAESVPEAKPRKDFTVSGKEAYLAGRFNDAAGLYKQALEERPDDTNVKYNIAMAFLNSDDYQNAAHWLKEVVKSNPRDTDACYNLGVIYESFLPDYDQAASYYRQFLKYGSSRPEADKVKEWLKYIERQTN